ncbi:MAG TPA: glycoside hydrolase family 36 N-terminal domain-containing protein, partial [Ornithinibacter sp.]|nr:glycoside hydrolase family 36 N-terminal domain-containing protein [Ornithinibacter sp.]
MTSPDTAVFAVALSTQDVTLILDLSEGALPSVVHWGEPLEDLQPRDLHAVVATGVALNGANDIDPPRRVAVLPEQHRAWAGRPGLQGSRDGRSWSRRFVVERTALDGEPLTGTHVGGPGLLQVHATDEHAGLALHLEIGLEPSGLVRARACVTNVADDGFTVDALTLAMPLPAGLDELLDFGGRWGHERVPQRQPLHTGIHSRENR